MCRPTSAHQLFTVVLVCLLFGNITSYKRREDKSKCPKVRPIRNFDLEDFMGHWYVVQYYASSEEDLAYKCMRADFFVSSSTRLEITLNFTYSFTDDPDNDLLSGNITWIIPDSKQPAHWVHAEETYEGVYNTYVLDSDYKGWSLIMHCAEKSKSPRYLSSFIMSRTPRLTSNVISFLRDKLPKYDIDLEYMFPMVQTGCSGNDKALHYAPPKKKSSGRRHPLKQIHH